MAVVPNTEPEKYGGASSTTDGVITGFVRRGSTGAVVSLHRCAGGGGRGVRVGARQSRTNRSRTLYPALIAARARLRPRVRLPAEFFDIGTPADYLDVAALGGARAGTRAARRRAQRRSDGAHRALDPVGRCGGGSGRDAARVHRHRRRARASGHVVARGQPARATASSHDRARRIGELAIAAL